MLNPLLVAAAMSLALSAGAASAATVVFTETFDDEVAAVGGSALNFNGFTNFTVSNGTVDLIESGDFGIDCVGGLGGCVDLNGTTGDVGLLSDVITFTAGERYRLTFDLSGSQVVGGGINDTVRFGVMGLIPDQLVTLGNAAPFGPYEVEFTAATSGDFSLFFKNGAPDSDNIGAVLDNVQLVAAVPVPAAGLLLLGALGALGVARRRRAA